MKAWKKLGLSFVAFAMTLTMLPTNISFVKAADSVNLALKKPATVNDAETSYWGADKAVDGIANVDETNKADQSRWSTNQQEGTPFWLKIDLEAEKTFQSFVLIWERTNITGYKIQTSNTGADDSWTDVYTKTGDNEITSRAEMIRLNESVTARYVRLYVDGYTPGTINWRSISLYEFQVYEDNIPGSAIPTSLRTGDNKLLSKTATASESEPGTTFTPDKAVDGVVNRTVADKTKQSRWATNQIKDGRGAWLKVDMGSVQVIQSLRMEWERTNITGYEILLSDDGINWQQVYKKAGTAEILSEVEVVNFDTAYTGRFVKINVTGSTEGTIKWNSISLYELEAYSVKTKTEKSVAEVTAAITEATLNEDVTALVMPEVPEGFTVELLGSDYEQVISADGSVHRPLTNKDVVLNFKVSKDDETATTKDIKLTVPGLHDTAGTNAKPTVIPELAEWYGYEGDFTIADTSKIVLDPAVSDAYMGMAEEFAADYKDIVGTDIAIEVGTAPAAHDFYFTTYADKALGEEGYIIDVKDTATISSIDKTGAYWSTRSILQIIKQTGNRIPQGITRDYPKYKVRGFMLDVGRKPFTFEYVEEVAKNMSWYKLNEFQLHLSDNYIWVEDYSNNGKDPREHAYSAFRLESDIVGENGVALTAKDVYYTKDEMRSFIQGARNYGINVIPEFDTPAHSLAYTKVRPDLAMTDKSISRWADHLDLTGDNYAKSVEFIQSVFNEYMTGDNPVFDKDTTINIGTDEYSSKYKKEFQKYTADMIDFVRDSGRNVRLWGSLGGSTSVAGSPKIDPENVGLNMWNTGYANPTAMMNEGFDLVNMNDGNLYIVPGANYYYDYLNPQTLYNGYSANTFGSTKLPAGAPNMAGAVFAVWNDYVDKSSNGISEYEVTKRIFPIFSSFSERLWGDAKDKTYNEFKDVVSVTNQAPNTNIKYEVETEAAEVVEYTFKNGMKDATANGYDGTELKNASVEKVDGKSALKLNGTASYMATPMDNLAPNFEVSFDVKRTTDSTEEQVLFESSKGTIKAVQKVTGNVGYSRDFYDYSFNYTLPVGEWHNIRIQSSGITVTLFVDDVQVDQIAGLGKSDNKGTKNNYPTLTMPLSRIGSDTSAFTGYITNIVLTKGSVSDKYKLPESALTATATSYNNGDDPENMVDGDTNTMWHSYYSAGEAGVWPYSAKLAFDQVYNINKISMLPRQSGVNGIITGYKLYAVLADDTEKLVAEGTWANTSALKEVTFESIEAKGIRLEATASYGDSGINKFASIAELSVYKTPDQETPEDTTFVKGILKNTITKAENIVSSDDFTKLAPAVQANVRTRLADAKAVYDNTKATIEEVMSVWSNLAKAIQYLDFKADKTELNNLITECDAIDTSMYVEGVEAFKAALELAKTTAADDNALQARIDNVYAQLFAAKEGLKASSVDKTSLKKMLEIANAAIGNEANYAKDDNWTAFISATDEAEAVFENAKATQIEINMAIAKLAAAYENIRLIPNEELLKALKDFINVAEAMDVSLYSATDYAFVRNTMATAKMMLETTSYTEEQVVEIKAQIEKSYAIIENNKITAPETPGASDPTDTPVDPAQPNEEGNAVSKPETTTPVKGTTKPATGDTTNMMNVIVLLGGAALCAMYAKKRSRK